MYNYYSIQCIVYNVKSLDGVSVSQSITKIPPVLVTEELYAELLMRLVPMNGRKASLQSLTGFQDSLFQQVRFLQSKCVICVLLTIQLILSKQFVPNVTTCDN